MAAKKKAASAGATLLALKDSPALRRLLEDPELRANIAQAFSSTQRAYGRLDGKKAGKQLFDDKRLQKDLSKAAESFRDASFALREGPKKQRGFGLGRLLVLTVLGAGVALGVSEGLRKKVLDALFGAEEEFEYTPTTPATTVGGDAGTTTTTTSTSTGTTTT